MKKQVISLFIVLLLFSCTKTSTARNTYSPENSERNQITLLKFVIDYGLINNNNATNDLMKAKAYTALYTIGEDGVVYLAVIWPVSGTQSFGKLIPTKPINFNKSVSNSDSITTNYKWYYNNTYDDAVGIADVTLTYQNGRMSLKMVTEKNDTGIYKGNIVSL